jgi:hypothetical protein
MTQILRMTRIKPKRVVARVEMSAPAGTAFRGGVTEGQYG